MGLLEDLHPPNGNKKADIVPDTANKELDDKALKNLRKWYKNDYNFIEL